LTDCFFSDRASQIQSIFNEFDKDGSGAVSIEEAKAMLEQIDIPEEEVESLVRMYDSNKDGELQYGEFVAFLLHS
jgi:Ca2+-binding EF-hand superfamily protein